MSKRCRKCRARQVGDRVLMDRLPWNGGGKRREEWATVTAISPEPHQLLLAAKFDDGAAAWQGDRVLWGCICEKPA